MAKKAKKVAAKKPQAKAAKKAAPARAAKKAKAPKPPKNEQLELIKGVRYAELDRLCSQIGDNRDEVNDLKSQGKDIEQNALKAMRLRGVTGYNYRGVTLMIVEGDQKLRVIKARDGQASQSSGALNQPEGGGEPGEGQDAGNIADSLTENEPED